MLFVLKYDDEVRKFLDKVTKLVEKQAVVNLSEKFPQRSLKQNSYLHLILTYFASEYGCTPDDAKQDYFKKLVNPDIFVREKENKKGKVVRYCRSSSELTTQEMTLAIDRFRHWSAIEGDIYLPSPDDRDFILHCEQEIERNRQFVQYNDT